MSYGKLLAKIVAESGYQYKEVIEECNKRGRHIDKSYFSRLLNDKVNPPSEELSRMFADICNVDARKLILEGYIDKAPKEIIDVLVSLKLMVYTFSSKIYENEITDDLLSDLKKKLEKEPLSDFILSLQDNLKDLKYMNNIEISENNFNYKIEEPLALTITDNGLAPKITEGSKIILKLKSTYDTGDILAIKPNKEENIITRIAVLDNETITLIPLNKSYSKLTYNLQDITILGKVVKVITEI